MADDAFAACLAFTLKYEGGFVDHPADPGGATNLGVTRATLARWRRSPVSKADVKALTRDEAGEIYRRFYWRPVDGGLLPPGVDAVVFDWAVHSGPARALQALRKALGVTRSGASLAKALENADAVALVRALCADRRRFLARLKGSVVFGRGWSRRVDALEAMALPLARSAPRGGSLSHASVNKGDRDDQR